MTKTIVKLDRKVPICSSDDEVPVGNSTQLNPIFCMSPTFITISGDKLKEEWFCSFIKGLAGKSFFKVFI
jgi:hypothetical protein